MTDDLVQFLRDRLDEDELTAKAADPGLGNLLSQVEYLDDEVQADERHIARHDPARVLREVDAKRGMIEIHTVVGGFEDEDMTDLGLGCSECGYSAEYSDQGGWCDTVRLLAVPYADHADYQQEWTP
ncbi:DUF6221 family protein [Streptomyces sp. NRRL B-24720]|uniref:DUF6221 family protein n=1 Tax=Streptomyces sp. NRRL B-24720 TaxID=1476876 RepID=UPI0004CC000B|nr:DUF6221 family protein [Streptomyces sp. NRRL B-24720]